MAYSYIEYTANGSVNLFPFPFPYIEQSHIKAYLDGDATTAFSFVNASTITMNNVPANGTIVKVARETPKGARLVNFTNGSVLRESTLDKDSNHMFYVMQEVYDQFQDLIPVIATIGELLEYGAASLGSNTFNGDQVVNGTISGAVIKDAIFEDYSETKVNVVGTSGNITLDLSLGNAFIFGPTGTTTFTFSTDGDVSSFTLVMTTGGLYTITWPGSVVWPQGVEPTLSDEYTDVLIFTTFDGGTTWYGSMALDACR